MFTVSRFVRANQRGSSMHAVVIPATFNDGLSAAKSELPGLVAQVSGAPGFVAGYWAAMSEDHGTAVVVFQSEDAARTFAASMPDGRSPGGVSTGNIEIGEVLGHA
jgi:hypothetical protein